eukprot:m.159246 g.159246  ORF g.159246 m.159246 type:complete len:204 (+) comp31129_c2_seq1:847-1458(+)
MSKSKVESEEEHDYDEEALKLFEQLKLQLRLEFPVAKYNGLDPIFEHPTSGAKVYVGNLKTAQNRTKLGTYNIQSVVNCQNATSRNFHEKVAGFKYLRFSIANWQMSSRFLKHGIRTYLKPLFTFIDKELLAGRPVFIHCHAGAHRAGTAGVCYLMHAVNIDSPQALQIARKCRPVINPIGRLSELLRRFDVERKSSVTTAPV